MSGITKILCEKKSTWIQSDIIKSLLNYICINKVNGDILDIGCGDGKFSSELALVCNRFGKKVIGIEKETGFKKDFVQHSREKNMQWMNFDCNSKDALFFYLKNTFAFVFIDACYDINSTVIENIYKSLSPGGIIIVDDTNEPSIANLIKDYKTIDIDPKWQRGKSSLKSNATRHKEFQIIYK